MFNLYDHGGFSLMIVQPAIEKIERSIWERITKRPFFTKHKERLHEVLEDGQVVRHGNTLMMNSKTYKAFKDSQ